MRLCVNAPRQHALRLQGLLCFVLIIASFALSFLPIFSINFTEAAVVNEIIEMINESTDAEITADKIPEKVDVSFMKLVDVGKLGKKVATIIANANSDRSEDGDEAAMKDLYDTLFDENGEIRESVLQSFLVIAGLYRIVLKDGILGEDFSFSAFGRLIRTIVVIFAVFYLVFFTLFLPLVFLFKALLSIIPAIQCIANPNDKTSKIAKRLVAAVTMVPTIMMFQAILPSISLGNGTLLLWAAALAGVLVSLLASRLRDYADDDLRYANVVQGMSVFSVAGIMIYFLNGVKGGVFDSFMMGAWSDYTVLAAAASDSGEKIPTTYLIDGVLIVLALIFFMSSVKLFGKLVRRLSLTANNKLVGSGDSHIFGSVTMILSIVFIFYVKSAKHNDLTEEPTSFLNLTAQQTNALTFALVGAIIVFASEIVLKILKKKFCGDMTREDQSAVLTGTAKTPEEKATANIGSL